MKNIVTLSDTESSDSSADDQSSSFFVAGDSKYKAKLATENKKLPLYFPGSSLQPGTILLILGVAIAALVFCIGCFSEEESKTSENGAFLKTSSSSMVVVAEEGFQHG